MWLWRPRILEVIEDAIFCTKSPHRWRLSSQLYAPAALFSQNGFLILNSLRDGVNPRAMLRLKIIGSFKKFFHFIGA
jgi:hypothetical protein